ncbi:MAG: PEP-CTERM sorting domain-containing protein [Planctomycetota bacterium]
MIRPLAFSLLAATLAAVLTASPSHATDLESFFFNDANGTVLTGAANTANPGNGWFYDPAEEAIDASATEAGVYELISGGTSGNTGRIDRFLDIGNNVTSGTAYLTTTFDSWDFGSFIGSEEDIRFALLDNDTGISGQTITAQVQIQRNTEDGTGNSIELFSEAFGSAGSFDIGNRVTLSESQTAPFQLVLAVDLTSDSYEVFYKDGSNPSQVLGLGGVSRARDANSVRWTTDEFGVGNIPPNFTPEFANVDSLVVSTTNPLTDLITLEIDRVTGDATLVNNSGAAITGVTGIEFPVDLSMIDGIDDSQVGAVPATIASGQTLPLGSAVWTRTPIEDVRAQLTTSSGVRTLDVDFVGNGGVKYLAGDLDFDGSLDADDYGILTTNAETPLAGTDAENYQLGDLNGDGFNDVIDFGIFKDDFIAANGATAFQLMIAGVPEPGTAVLALAGLSLAFAGGRRRVSTPASHTPLKSPPMSRLCHAATALMPLVALAILGTAPHATALVVHDFPFNDPAGTAIPSVANVVDPLTQFDIDSGTGGDANVSVITNGVGQLDLSGKDNDDFGSNYIDINPGITEGKVFAVLEATWDFQSPLDATQNEELRMSFIDADDRSTRITAQVEIERTDADVLDIFGTALGSGTGISAGSDISPVTLNGGSLTQSTASVTVLAADLTLDSYEVFFSDNAGASFQSIGVGTIDDSRNVEAVRLVINNDFTNDNVLIDRFFVETGELTEYDLTLSEPDRLALYVHPKSGHAALVNDTGATFDIDYYRVQRGDVALIEPNWRSLEDQGVDAVDGADPGSTAGDSLGETWVEAGGSGPDLLSESFLLSSSVLDADEALPLGRVIDLSGDETQLTFEYRDAVSGNVAMGEVVVMELLPGDFNLDGSVDIADYTVWRDNASGLFSPSDYTVWVNNFGAQFGGSSLAVPEPGAVGLLSLLALASLCGFRRGTPAAACRQVA